MSKSSGNSNFIRIINRETQEEIYHIQFDFGTKKIDVKEGVKITLDYVHGGFNQVFSRMGDDLIVGDDTVFVRFQRLGVGFGKEVWDVVQDEDSNYNITVTKYSWSGGSVGYVKTNDVYEQIMTPDELEEFQAQHNVVVSVGENTLYTTWPVLPNPTISYHMEDCGDYDPANGKIILRNYFKYGKDSVYIGDKLLSLIIQEDPKYESIIKNNSKKPYDITDTFFSENLYGGDKNDKIRSYQGDDTIDPGKGDDKIYLGAGNKTIIINQGDGKDTIYNFQKADSVNFQYDDFDNIYYTKSKNNLIINRTYGDTTEQTVIDNYFKNYDKNNKLIVTQDDEVITDDLTKELSEGTKYLTAQKTSKVIKGSDLSDEAFSTDKNETFALGKGNDVIRFREQDGFQLVPYSFGKDVVKLTKDSHLTLDMSSVGGDISVTKKGNDAIVTAYHRMEICGRDNGKEDWVILKSGKDAYTVTKTEYYFTGKGYKPYGTSTEVTMTKSELEAFEKESGIKLKVGKNTLYTSWAVVANPVKHYSYTDSANYGSFLGSVTIKDYFLYGGDSVYIGDKLLSEYLDEDILTIDKSGANKKQTIKDTALDEVIMGSKYSDKITSNKGDDVITAGKGDDKIIIAEGNKTINISKDDGKDTLIIKSNNTSTLINFEDATEISFDAKRNDLIITRNYADGAETTIIKDYYKNNLDNDIKVAVDGFVVWSNSGTALSLVSKLLGNVSPLPNSNNSNVITGTLYAPASYNPELALNDINQIIVSWQSSEGSLSEITDTQQNYDDISTILVQPE